MKLIKIVRRYKMNTLSTNSGIKIPAPVLLYMLNIQKGSNFEVNCNGNKITSESGENGLAVIKEGRHKEDALKIGKNGAAKYFIGPFFVESFPDDNHILSFHCKNIKMSKNCI